MVEHSQQGSPERPDFPYYVTLVDEPELLIYETQEGRFSIDYPTEHTGAPERIGDPSLSREAVLERLEEQARIENDFHKPSSRKGSDTIGTPQRWLPEPEPEPTVKSQPASWGQKPERFWSLEESAKALDGLLGLDEKLAGEVQSLAGGSVEAARVIKERLADKISYDPGESLTPKRIRAIVGAPSDPNLLEIWRTRLISEKE